MHPLHMFLTNTDLAQRQEEESQQMSLKEEGLVAYQRKALHETGSSTKEQTKAALAGRQKINEQTKKFMKKEYVCHIVGNI